MVHNFTPPYTCTHNSGLCLKNGLSHSHVVYYYYTLKINHVNDVEQNLFFIIVLLLFLEADISDIIKVDGGDSMLVSCLQHAASQAPVLGVRAELQDLVIVVMIIATWI